MLYIDGINLRFLVKELHEKLKGKKVSRIIQYDNLSFSLFFGKDNLARAVMYGLTHIPGVLPAIIRQTHGKVLNVSAV